MSSLAAWTKTCRMLGLCIATHPTNPLVLYFSSATEVEWLNDRIAASPLSYSAAVSMAISLTRQWQLAVSHARHGWAIYDPSWVLCISQREKTAPTYLYMDVDGMLLLTEDNLFRLTYKPSPSPSPISSAPEMRTLKQLPANVPMAAAFWSLGQCVMSAHGRDGGIGSPLYWFLQGTQRENVRERKCVLLV